MTLGQIESLDPILQIVMQKLYRRHLRQITTGSSEYLVLVSGLIGGLLE